MPWTYWNLKPPSFSPFPSEVSGKSSKPWLAIAANPGPSSTFLEVSSSLWSAPGIFCINLPHQWPFFKPQLSSSHSHHSHPFPSRAGSASPRACRCVTWGSSELLPLSSATGGTPMAWPWKNQAMPQHGDHDIWCTWKYINIRYVYIIKNWIYNTLIYNSILIFGWMIFRELHIDLDLIGCYMHVFGWTL